MAVVTQGLEQDDVVVQVADWSAKGATVAEVSQLPRAEGSGTHW